MQNDCLQQQAEQGKRMRQYDPGRQDCEARRRELRVKVEEQRRRG